jgi:uncharacterized protein (DUF427 family)
MTNDPQDTQRIYWRNLVRERPEATDIVVPGPGQESVWDYPRPPAIEAVPERLLVDYAGVTLAETNDGLRVIETSSPPVYYFPVEHVRTDFLMRMIHTTLCEWKGVATYWTVNIRGRRQEAIAWSYEAPDAEYERLQGYFAFYPNLVDACYVGLEPVVRQPGDYYGGWVTSAIVGPFKGTPGTERW